MVPPTILPASKVNILDKSILKQLRSGASLSSLDDVAVE